MRILRKASDECRSKGAYADAGIRVESIIVAKGSCLKAKECTESRDEERREVAAK